MRTGTEINAYMGHPLVRTYLSDLDAALEGTDSSEARIIKQSVREHLVSEFALVKQELPDQQIVAEILDRLGPVDSIANTLGEANLPHARRDVVPQKTTTPTIILTALSVALLPFAAGVSAALSAIALVIAIRWRPSRTRGYVISANVVVLAVALVLLITAFVTASLLLGTDVGVG